MKKLVLFEFHLLGDAIMSLPFVQAAREKYDLYVCCSTAAGRIYELVLPPERIFRRELGSGHKSNPVVEKQVRGAVRELKADIGVTVWADVRVHLLMRSLGIPERMGFPMNRRNYYGHNVDWRRRNLHIGQAIQFATGWMRPLTTKLQRREYFQHHMEDFHQLAAALDIAPDYRRPWFGKDFALPEKARPFFERNAGRKIWMLHPGASKVQRCWPRFQELVDTVFGPAGVPLVILEDPAIPPLRAAHENCLVWPMSTLSDFIGLVGGCDQVLGNDSAAGHIAAAMGKPMISIFGSGLPAWFAPQTGERMVIESFICKYRPCFDRCKQPSVICLEDISLARVAERIAPLL